MAKIMKTNKSIAILGGMGPQASAKLLQLVIEMAASEYGARNDDDFPEVIVSSVPVPDFISNKRTAEAVLNILKARVRNLESFNPKSFSIACNTAHILLKDLQRETNIPFISIIDEVVKEISNRRMRRVGLLGTPVTLRSMLYQDALRQKGIRILVPSSTDQEIVERIIRNILAGKKETTDIKELVRISKELEIKGAQGIVLGCTELPLIFPKKDITTFDSIEILAKALLKDYYFS